MSAFMIIVLFVALILFLTFPRLSKQKEFDAFEKYDYAHRGLHNEQFPENSLAAFEHAKNKGYGMELDVQLTKDHVCVVMHDFTLLRACGIDKSIDECTYDEIKDLPLFHSTYSIPTFEEVLQCIDGTVPLIIEIKQKGIDCSVCKETWKLLKNYQGKYVVESFNPYAMNWFLKNHPQIIRGQLSCTFSEDKKMNKCLKFALKNLLTNCLSRPDFIAYEVNERHVFMNQLHHHLFHSKLVYWTVRDQAQYEEVKSEASMIIFENFEA